VRERITADERAALRIDTSRHGAKRNRRALVILTALLSKQVQFAPWSDADQVAQIRAYALEHLADPNLACDAISDGVALSVRRRRSSGL
jgi:hypothetical protein